MRRKNAEAQVALPTELLRLINDYQAGRALLSDEFIGRVRALAPVQVARRPPPTLYYKTDLTLFGEDVHGRSMRWLLSPGGVKLPAASFTTSEEFAKRHRLDKARENEATFAIIFVLSPARHRTVLLDLDSLYSSGAIAEAVVEAGESEFENGILAVGNHEHEIILESVTVTVRPDDVFAIRNPHQDIAAFDKALEEVSEDAELHAERSIDLYEKLQMPACWENRRRGCTAARRSAFSRLCWSVSKGGKGAGELISSDSIFIEDEGGLDAISVPPY